MNATEMVAPVADAIRRSAEEVEMTRQLPPELVERLAEAGLLSIYTPAVFGGPEFPLPEALRVAEEVSRHDGSTGWTVALGFGNNLFSSVLPDASAAPMFKDGWTLMAGSPGFMVQARPVEGGYRLTGQWQFASGASNARWMNVAAPIFDGEGPRMGPHGMPER